MRGPNHEYHVHVAPTSHAKAEKVFETIRMFSVNIMEFNCKIYKETEMLSIYSKGEFTYLKQLVESNLTLRMLNQTKKRH